MRIEGKEVFRRKGSRFYYYRTGAGGKTWVCTYETDKREAEKKAREHRGAARGKFDLDELFTLLLSRLEALPDNERDAKRENFGKTLLRISPDVLPFSEAWATWMSMPNKSKFGNPKPNTLAGYSAIWKRLEKWAGGQNVQNLHELTPKQAEAYMADLWKAGVSERTYSAHLKQLKAMFRTLKNQAGIVLNPFEEIKPMELDTQGREAFTRDELATICAKASGDWRYLVGIGIYTGLRLTDALHLRWEDYEAGIITVKPAKVARRKKGNKKVVTIGAHDVLKMLLEELRRLRGGNPSGYMFPALVKEYAKDRTAASVAFGKFLRDECEIETTAEIEEGTQRKRRANLRGFHALRHSFVSMCAEAKVPITTIRDAVGHATALQSLDYAHADNAEQRAAINLLPSGFFADVK